MGAWKSIGKGFASVGKGAAQAAVWASQHPEVLAEVASITGQPAVAAAIGTAAVLVARGAPATSAAAEQDRGIEWALSQLAALEADLAGHPGAEAFAPRVHRISAALVLQAQGAT